MQSVFALITVNSLVAFRTTHLLYHTMKKSPLKRGTKQMKRSGFKRKLPSNDTNPQLRVLRSSKSRLGGNKRPPQTISKLKKKLWKLFSLFIRQRDSYTCFTCGRQGEGSGMHAGHFISKAIGGNALYFNEDNVHAQCYNCNINLGGNQYIYGKKLGKKKAEELYKIKNQVIEKWSVQDYEEKIEYYKNML